MKPTLSFLFFLLLLVGSCSDVNRVKMQQLSHVDSLMEKNPQAAYDSLCQDSLAFMKGNGRCVEMKYRLLKAKAQNKLYLQMPSDSTFQDVVAYYDGHGTSNERMQAHYLLGCVFRDQREAPKAIQCYEEAIECADTLSNTCDFVSLYSIYGQMVDIYTQQNLLHSAISITQKYCEYALRCNDSLSYIGGNEQLAALYLSLGDTVKTVSKIEQCISLYKRSRMDKSAAGALPLLISIYISRQQYEKAYRCMQYFENKSGLFDNKSDICKGREYYYNLKGRYFLGVNRLDSAEFYFKKIDYYGFHYEANRGLLAICEKRQKWNEAYKFVISCENAMDQILKGNQANAVLQVSKMYDFQRLQKQIDAKQIAKKRLEVNLLTILLVLFVFLVLTCYFLKVYRKQLKYKREELERNSKEIEELKENLTFAETWNDKYLKTSQELQKCKNELDSLRENYEVLKRRESKMITEGQDVIDKDKIYQLFKKKGLGLYDNYVISDVTWEKLRGVVEKYFPSFNKTIGKKENMLSKKEWHVVLLTRLHFSNSEIANILSTSPASVSNAKLSANKKMYKGDNARTLLNNMLKDGNI